MAEKEERIVQIKSDEEPHGEGVLHITHYKKSECVKRAATMLGLCWLGAVGSIPIVIAHWVLVPGFLIAGLVLGYIRLNQATVKERILGKCPVIDKDIKIDMEPGEDLPKWTYCPACNKSIQLVE
jgi:hypothetical protein